MGQKRGSDKTCSTEKLVSSPSCPHSLLRIRVVYEVNQGEWIFLPRLYFVFRRNSTTITTAVSQKAKFYGFTGLVIINLILLICVSINLSQLSSYNDTLENTKILNKILISKTINETKLEEAFQRTRIVVESSNLSIYIFSTLYVFKSNIL